MNNKIGSAILELLIVMGLMAILLPALLTGLYTSRSGKAQENQRVQAVALMKETQEAVKNIRNRNWNTFATDGTFHPVIAPTPSPAVWTLQSGSASVNGFTQTVVISSVSRVVAGNIVTPTPSVTVVDPSTKKVDVTVSWSTPLTTSVTSTMYLTRYQNVTLYSQTTQSDFTGDIQNNVVVTNTSGGEVVLGPNPHAKWCSPTLSSENITLPDGPPVAVAARADSNSTAVPNDVLVAVAPFATSSAKLAYVNVSANQDPPVSTLKGIFSLDPAQYSAPTLVPTPTIIGLDNSFKTNSVKYYTSSTGKLYALLATTKPDREIVAVLVNDNDNSSNSEYQDPVNKIFKYWTFFNTKIYGQPTPTPPSPTYTPIPTYTPVPSYTPVPTFTPMPTPTPLTVVNGSFETGNISPFNTIINSGTGTIVNSPVHAGSNSARVTTTQTAVSGVAGGGSCAGGKRIPVSTNTTYSWSGWINVPSAGNTKFVDARIRVSWYTACTAGSVTGTSDSTLLATKTGVWTQVTGLASSATGTFAEVQLLLRSSQAGTTSTAYFDDLLMSPVAPTVTPQPTLTSSPTPTTPVFTPTPTIIPSPTPLPNDQAPFGYGATALAVQGNTGYLTSGGYLYVFDLSNIDSKSTNNGLDQLGCRILLDGYDCQPGSPGFGQKYNAGQNGATFGPTQQPIHNDCSDGGNIELNADNDVYPIRVTAPNPTPGTFAYIAVGGMTVPELNVVDVSTPPTGATLSNNSCGRGSTAGWSVISNLDFNAANNTEEAANSVFVKSDGTRAYMSSNGGIDANGDGQPDSKQFYILDTSVKNAPKFLLTNPSPTPQFGFYTGGIISPTPSGPIYHNDRLFPRRSMTVLNGARAVLVGKDGLTPTPGVTGPEEYQVLNIDSNTINPNAPTPGSSYEKYPAYCGGVNFDSGFNDLTSVTEADTDTFVYMVANTPDHQLKLIEGGPDVTYSASGTLESATFDAGSNVIFNRLSATINTPSGTSINFQAAVANPVSGSCAGAIFTFLGPAGTSDPADVYSATGGQIYLGSSGSYVNPGRCFRYKAYFYSSDSNTTPILNDVSVNYTP